MGTSAAVLRNKGAKIRVAEAILDEFAKWTANRDEDTGEPVLEDRWIKFDNNVLADLEESYGSSAAYVLELQSKPQSAMRKILSIMWDIDERRVGAMLLPELTDEYNVAFGAAFSLSQGVDPTVAATMIDRATDGIEQLAAAKNAGATRMAEELGEVALLAEAEIAALGHSTSGSPSGSESADDPTISGDPPPDKSPSS